MGLAPNHSPSTSCPSSATACPPLSSLESSFTAIRTDCSLKTHDSAVGLGSWFLSKRHTARAGRILVARGFAVLMTTSDIPIRVSYLRSGISLPVTTPLLTAFCDRPSPNCVIFMVGSGGWAHICQSRWSTYKSPTAEARDAGRPARSMAAPANPIRAHPPHRTIVGPPVLVSRWEIARLSPAMIEALLGMCSEVPPRQRMRVDITSRPSTVRFCALPVKPSERGLPLIEPTA
jgi:hypothetical protein